MPVAEKGGRGHCAVCESDDQGEIEELLAGGTTKAAVEKRFGISRRSLTRHLTAHLNPALSKIARERTEATGRRLVDRLESLLSSTMGILAASLSGDAVVKCPSCKGEVVIAHSPNASQALTAIREIRSTLELLGKVTGELDSRPVTVINFETTPDWVQARTRMLVALVPFPEARQAVADALRQIN